MHDGARKAVGLAQEWLTNRQHRPFGLISERPVRINARMNEQIVTGRVGKGQAFQKAQMFRGHSAPRTGKRSLLSAHAIGGEGLSPALLHQLLEGCFALACDRVEEELIVVAAQCDPALTTLRSFNKPLQHLAAGWAAIHKISEEDDGRILRQRRGVRLDHCQQTVKFGAHAMNVANAVVDTRKASAVELTPRRLAAIRRNGRGRLSQRNSRAIRYPTQALPAPQVRNNWSPLAPKIVMSRFAPFVFALLTAIHKVDQLVASVSEAGCRAISGRSESEMIRCS